MTDCRYPWQAQSALFQTLTCTIRTERYQNPTRRTIEHQGKQKVKDLNSSHEKVATNLQKLSTIVASTTVQNEIRKFSWKAGKTFPTNCKLLSLSESCYDSIDGARDFVSQRKRGRQHFCPKIGSQAHRVIASTHRSRGGWR